MLNAQVTPSLVPLTHVRTALSSRGFFSIPSAGARLPCSNQGKQSHRPQEPPYSFSSITSNRVCPCQGCSLSAFDVPTPVLGGTSHFFWKMGFVFFSNKNLFKKNIGTHLSSPRGPAVLEMPANPSFANPTGTSSELTVRLAAVAWLPPHTALEKVHGSDLMASSWQRFGLPLLLSEGGMGLPPMRCRKCHWWVTLGSW